MKALNLVVLGLVLLSSNGHAEGKCFFAGEPITSILPFFVKQYSVVVEDAQNCTKVRLSCNAVKRYSDDFECNPAGITSFNSEGLKPIKFSGKRTRVDGVTKSFEVIAQDKDTGESISYQCDGSEPVMPYWASAPGEAGCKLLQAATNSNKGPSVADDINGKNGESKAPPMGAAAAADATQP